MFRLRIPGYLGSAGDEKLRRSEPISRTAPPALVTNARRAVVSHCARQNPILAERLPVLETPTHAGCSQSEADVWHSEARIRTVCVATLPVKRKSRSFITSDTIDMSRDLRSLHKLAGSPDSAEIPESYPGASPRGQLRQLALVLQAFLHLRTRQERQQLVVVALDPVRAVADGPLVALARDDL